MAKILCMHCGRRIPRREKSQADARCCSACGAQFKAAPDGIRTHSGDGSLDPHQRLLDEDCTKANLHEVDQPITLRCPECEATYAWPASFVLSGEYRSPSCEHCSTPYPMECHDCGLDLSVDGFGVRMLKETKEDGAEERAWGLFCPECLDAYDRFSVPRFELKPCVQCWKMVAAGELHLRQINEKLEPGALACHQSIMVGLCSECARTVDSGPKTFITSMAILLGLVGLFILLCWFIS
jgi:hypothetical protein